MQPTSWKTTNNNRYLIISLQFAKKEKCIIYHLFFLKDDIYSFKARNSCGEFLGFKYVVIVFFETKEMITYICTSEILKIRV